MPRLDLVLSSDDSEARAAVGFFETRRYVVRQMVPTGYEQYFQARARLASAHSTTVIEGNPLEYEQAAMVILSGADEDDPAEVEIQNAEAAYELIAQLASDRTTTIDEGLVRTINSILLKGLPGRAEQGRGKYRLGGARVVDRATRDVRYNPPPPEWVPELMRNLVADANGWIANEPPPIAAAKLHFGLVSIHPFEDGNGRTARLLADFILEQTCWSIDGMLSINRILLDRRDDYYDALRESQGLDFAAEIDVTPFVRFHTDAIVMAAADLEEQVVALSRRRDEVARMGQGVLSDRQVIGLMYMVDMGPLATSTYARLSGCSQSAALTDLNELMLRDAVERIGSGKNTRYAIVPREAAGS